MSPAEVEWMSCHLGHEVNTHKRSYRQHTAAITITKVGPLLNLLDSGVMDRHHLQTPDASRQGLSFIMQRNARLN